MDETAETPVELGAGAIDEQQSAIEQIFAQRLQIGSGDVDAAITGHKNEWRSEPFGILPQRANRMTLALRGDLEPGGVVEFLQKIDVGPERPAHAGVPRAATVFQADEPHQCVIHAIRPTTGRAATRAESAPRPAAAHSFRAVLSDCAHRLDARSIRLISNLGGLLDIFVNAGIIEVGHVKRNGRVRVDQQFAFLFFLGLDDLDLHQLLGDAGALRAAATRGRATALRHPVRRHAPPHRQHPRQDHNYHQMHAQT